MNGRLVYSGLDRSPDGDLHHALVMSVSVCLSYALAACPSFRTKPKQTFCTVRTRKMSPTAPSCVQLVVDACLAAEVAATAIASRYRSPDSIARSLHQCSVSRSPASCEINHKTLHTSHGRWKPASSGGRPRVAVAISYSLLSRSRRGSHASALYSCGAALAWTALHSSRLADSSRFDFEVIVIHDGSQSEAELAALRRVGARTHGVRDEQLSAFCLSQTHGTATSRDPMRAQRIPRDACWSERVPSSGSYDDATAKASSSSAASISDYISGELVLSHFLKVEAWRLVEYDAVLFCDTDVYLKPEPSQLAHLEDAVDFLLRAPADFGPVFVHEPPCSNVGHACVMAGLFLLRPALADYWRLIAGILSGFHGIGQGWGAAGNASVVYANLGRPLAAPGTTRKDLLFWRSGAVSAENATVERLLTDRSGSPWSFWAAESDQGLLTWAFAVDRTRGLAVWTEKMNFVHHFNSGCCQSQRLYGPRLDWCHDARHARLNTTHSASDAQPSVRMQRVVQMADRARRAHVGLTVAATGARDAAGVAPVVGEVELLELCASEMYTRVRCTRE